MGVGGERRGWSLVDGRQETANGVGNRSGLGFGVTAISMRVRVNSYHQRSSRGRTQRRRSALKRLIRTATCSRPNGRPRRPCSSLSSEAADFGFRLSTTQVFDRFFGDFR